VFVAVLKGVFDTEVVISTTQEVHGPVVKKKERQDLAASVAEYCLA